jgi:DNA polymerase-3 subunit chi
VSKVDFYIARDPSRQALLQIGCRVIEKAWQHGHRVYVLTDTADESRQLDDLLWTFRQDSFVPHALREADPAPTASPVLIGEADTLPPAVDVLVNLSSRLPGCAQDCARVAELVANDPPARAHARERYRHYRDLGARIDTHDV